MASTTESKGYPCAIVVAGLLIGNHGRTLAMSESTIEHLDTFWELVDEVLNAVLFVLIGLGYVPRMNGHCCPGSWILIGW